MGLLALTLVRGVLYAFVSPPWQGPDETTHFHYMAALRADGGLQSAWMPMLPEVYAQVWDDATRFRIWDYNDWPVKIFIKPLSPDDRFLVRAGGLYDRLLFPIFDLTADWSLTARLFALRIGSASLMLVTVAATYGIARSIFSKDSARERAIAWTAAACVAFQPMVAFLSASLNDDNLVPPLTALTTLGVLRALRSERDTRPNRGWLWWVLAGSSALAAVLTKRTGLTAVGALGIGLLACAIAWIARERGWRRMVGWLTVATAAALTVVALAVLALQPVLPAEITWRFQLPETVFPELAAALVRVVDQPAGTWLDRMLFLTLSFWGWFGWLKAPLAAPVISLLRYASALVILGVVVRLLRWAFAHRSAEARWRFGLALVLLAGCVVNFGLLLAQHLVDPGVFTLVGRYLFPSLGAWGVLTVAGWQAWWPKRWAAAGLYALTLAFVALDVYAWFFVMVPFYYA